MLTHLLNTCIISPLRVKGQLCFDGWKTNVELLGSSPVKVRYTFILCMEYITLAILYEL